MCIRDSVPTAAEAVNGVGQAVFMESAGGVDGRRHRQQHGPVSYTHLRAHETVLDLVCRLLLEKKKRNKSRQRYTQNRAEL